MTEQEFLDWVVRQDRRCEFDGEYPIPMVGNVLRHGRIQARLMLALGNRLRNTPYEVLGSDVFIRAHTRLRVPDAYVVARDTREDGRVLPDPLVVFETVSAGSARTDRIEKAREYFATPSIRHSVILEQDFPAAEVLSRAPQGWMRTAAGAGEAIALPAIGIEVAVREMYEGLRFPSSDA